MFRPMRVFVTHNPEDLEAYYGRALPQLEAIAEVVLNTTDRNLSTPELIEAASNCDVIVAHRATPGEKAVFEQLPNLLGFLRSAVDISTIDVDAASAAGVLVAHADKSFVPSTAELALALLMDTARSVSTSTVDYQNGVQPPQRPGRQLRGQTAGVIGYGAVGTYLAQLLFDLGMEVLVTDPFVTVEAEGIEQVELAELLGRSNAVFPMAPATAETHHLIGEKALAAMKSGATLINVSRGELLDEVAVAAALDSGHLGALGVDVGMDTDQRPSIALAGRPGVVATPHLGGLTPENADAQAASTVEQVAAMLEGEMPPRTANPNDATNLLAWWTKR